MKNNVTHSRLLELLADACELEHALCCSYLFSAFSIKRDLADGLDWRQQQITRLWASRIYHIAAQEMLHLAQVWNIMTAVGGSPYYGRPSFPQAAKHFPLDIALSLRRFDVATLDRFLVYERPEDTELEEAELSVNLWPLDEGFQYDSVGELYGEIARLLQELDEQSTFVGSLDMQADQELIDFYDVMQVTNRESALQSIDAILEQGEGSPEDREDSHFGVFTQLRRELNEAGFTPFLSVADNPYIRAGTRQHLISTSSEFEKNGIAVTEVTNSDSIHAMDLFNDVYILMLRALSHIFGTGTGEGAPRMRIARNALELMITVIKPLGEAICRMPSGQEGLNAGPDFNLSRHVNFPRNSTIAEQLFIGKLRELHGQGILLASATTGQIQHAQIISAVGNLGRLSRISEGA